MTTFESVRGIAAKLMDTNVEQITLETSLTRDLAANSLEVMEITMALEETFCITFDDEALTSDTVGHIVDYIEAHKGERP